MADFVSGSSILVLASHFGAGQALVRQRDTSRRRPHRRAGPGRRPRRPHRGGRRRVNGRTAFIVGKGGHAHVSVAACARADPVPVDRDPGPEDVLQDEFFAGPPDADADCSSASATMPRAGIISTKRGKRAFASRAASRRRRGSRPTRRSGKALSSAPARWSARGRGSARTSSSTLWPRWTMDCAVGDEHADRSRRHLGGGGRSGAPPFSACAAASCRESGSATGRS